mmetsp:Transcript_14418/g.32666  ORF Transcript_14418/g.32666 Transcript_14418/m.32666 type:complete len:205 (-) Transcript_14418:249-863(-)
MRAELAGIEYPPHLPRVLLLALAFPPHTPLLVPLEHAVAEHALYALAALLFLRARPRLAQREQLVDRHRRRLLGGGGGGGPPPPPRREAVADVGRRAARAERGGGEREGREEPQGHTGRARLPRVQGERAMACAVGRRGRGAGHVGGVGGTRYQRAPRACGAAAREPRAVIARTSRGVYGGLLQLYCGTYNLALRWLQGEVVQK